MIAEPSAPLLEFRNVHFGYTEGQEILHNISFKLEQGKTYALVGPTGGGKTTTASLIARLYDPGKGIVLLDGRDMRSYDAAERSQKIGFILQEPFYSQERYGRIFCMVTRFIKTIPANKWNRL